MSTITPAQSPPEAPTAPPGSIPPLYNGDRLTREEFLRRYEAMPHVNKAELIEGVVYMPSPVRQELHGKQYVDIITCLGNYSVMTPGVEAGGNSSLLLDLKSMPQPDGLLIIRPECGGRVRINKDGYIVGGPEFITEVSASTASYDLHDKLESYRRNGVQEYMVWRVEDRAIDWFMLKDDRFEPHHLSAEGFFKSVAFPGLWLDAQALLSADMTRVFAVVQMGLKSAEHATFVQQLAARRAANPS
jgi:Uma2 family endonuclease